MSKKLKPSKLTKFSVPCAFGSEASEVTIYIGSPEKNHHPIFFQNKFIQDNRGGSIPSSIMESLEKLKQLSEENGVPFDELCRYALGTLDETAKSNEQADASQIEDKSDKEIEDTEEE